MLIPFLKFKITVLVLPAWPHDPLASLKRLDNDSLRNVALIYLHIYAFPACYYILSQLASSPSWLLVSPPARFHVPSSLSEPPLTIWVRGLSSLMGRPSFCQLTTDR